MLITPQHIPKIKVVIQVFKMSKDKENGLHLQKIKHNTSLFDTIYKANLQPSAFKLVSDSHVARESHLMLQRKSH